MTIFQVETGGDFCHFLTDSLRTHGDFCHQGWNTEIYQKKFKIAKKCDVIIHWKTLEGHFLMVPLVFRFNHFRGKMHFLNFSKKTSVQLKSEIINAIAGVQGTQILG
jgi:hypothetical protein